MAGRKLLKRPERAASILAAAARAFATGGYAETSMDAIAAEAGVTRLIIYRHFDSKQELYEAVLDHTRTALRDAVRYRGDPQAGMVEPLVRAARRDPYGFTLLFRHSAREPRFAGYAAEFSHAATDVAEKGLQAAIADPLLLRWTARMALTLTIEGILTAMELDDPATDAELAERLLRTVGAMVQAVTA